jgi:hypothetical protein
MAFFLILQELLHLDWYYYAWFIPFLLLSINGFVASKRFDLLAFSLCLIGASVIWDLRIMLTAQIILLYGFAEWFNKTPYKGLRLIPVGVIFAINVYWWISQKLWYFGF